jgi:hypothetical protein
MLISFISFILLWKTQPREKETKPVEKVILEENLQDKLLSVQNDEVFVESATKTKLDKWTLQEIIYLLIILWTSILLIGCIPSINSYSLNPYGASTFHYVLILSK